MNALDRACQLAETQARLARKIDIKPQALHQWMRSGVVPPHRVIDVARAVDFGVTPHQLRPDLYPHPEDGLPDEMRTGQPGASAAQLEFPQMAAQVAP